MLNKKLLIRILFLVCVLFSGCTERLAKNVADNLYPDLQVPYDNEPPPTAMTYPASTSIRDVIGGKGEGLGCSIPPLLDKLMFSRGPKDAPLSLQFRQACVRHDYCYRHGWATYGYKQADCDFALQQDAYRVCRIVYDEQLTNEEKKNINPDEECLSRARRVLLGVRIGGAENFQSREKSTYFEYDPMPTSAADDYVVTRWVNESTSCNGKAENCLKGSFIVLHNKRGSVTAKKLSWDGVQNKSSFKTEAKLFPNAFVTTPPNIIWDNGKDRLVALARDNFHNTHLQVTGFNLDSILNTLNFTSEFIDKDASVFWISKPKNSDALLSYWSYTKHQNGWRVLNNGKLDGGWRSVGINDMHDLYRTLAHRPLEGNFFKQGERETLIFKRGGSVDSNGSNSGNGYKTELHIVPLATNQSKVIAIPAKEEDEPLVAIKNNDDQDLLMSLHVNDIDRVQFKLFDLMCVASASTPCLPSLTKEFRDKKNQIVDKSWVRQPVQLIFPVDATDAMKKSPLIFFSKIDKVCQNNKCEMTGNAQPHYLSYQFAISRLKSDSKQYQISDFISQVSCDIKVEPLSLLANNDDRLISLIKRAKPKNNIQNAYLADLVQQDFYERLANAQVIPGWFFKQTDDPSNDTAVDVAVIFRGYTNYSFLVSNIMDKESGDPKVFKAKSGVKQGFDINCKHI